MTKQTDELVLQVSAAQELLERNLREAGRNVELFEQTAEQRLDQLQEKFSGINLNAAVDAVRDADKAFKSSFDSINRQASTLAETLGKSGVVDLSPLIQQSQARATELSKEATVLRALADAEERRVAAIENATIAERAGVAAAQAAATASRGKADAAAAEVQRLQALNVELGNVTGSQNRSVVTSNAQRYAMINAGNQFQDFFVQVSGGTSVVRAFSQQAPQLVDALQLMALQAENTGGKFSVFASFLSSGWGVAFAAATPLVALLAQNLLGLGDAGDDAKKKSLDLTQAIHFEKMGTQELIKAINDLETAQHKQLQTAEESEKQSLDNAQASLKAATAKRDEAIATLQALQASQKVLQASPTRDNQGARFAVAGAIGVTQSDIDALSKAQGVAEKLVRETQVPIVQRSAQDLTDAHARIKDEYDAQLAKEKQLYVDGKISLDQYTAATDKLTAAREKALDAIKKHGDGEAALVERGEDAAKKVANIADKYSGMSKPDQGAARDLRELDDIADDFQKKKPPNYQALLDQITKAKALIADFDQKALQDAAAKTTSTILNSSLASGKPTGILAPPKEEPLADPEKLVEAHFAAIDRMKEAQAELKKLADETDKTWTTSAQAVIGSLQKMKGAIEGGDFLDILSAALGLFTQLGGLGVFGKSIQNNIKYPNGPQMRASGGPVSAGMPYIVGEKGPELFVPSGSGSIVANDNLRSPRVSSSSLAAIGSARSGPIVIQVEANDYFDARVRGQAAAVAGPMGAAAANAGAGLAAIKDARRRRNRIPSIAG